MPSTPIQTPAEWQPFLEDLEKHFHALYSVGHLLINGTGLGFTVADELASALDQLTRTATRLRSGAVTLPLPDGEPAPLDDRVAFIEDFYRCPVMTCVGCRAKTMHVFYTQRDCDAEELDEVEDYDGPEPVFCRACVKKRDRAYRAELGPHGRLAVRARIRFRHATQRARWFFRYTLAPRLRRTFRVLVGRPPCLHCNASSTGPVRCSRCPALVHLCAPCHLETGDPRAVTCARCTASEEGCV